MSEFARELGISVKQLYRWRNQYKLKSSESFPGNGNTTINEDAKALAQLKKEHARLQQEHEILKKAMGIISMSDLQSIGSYINIDLDGRLR